ncbi:MAG: endo-1,4-beta-xylanase [Bacteroidota bacterium]
MKNILLFYIIILVVNPIYTLSFKASITEKAFARAEMSFASKSFSDRSECDKVQLFEKADFPIGVAINFQKLVNEKNYRNLIISQFNSITAEKSMKATVIHPKQNVYDFSETDYLINFCQTHNKRLHGHTLVWDKETPRWMEKFKGDKNAWELMLKEHIQTVMQHCKNNVKSWDVLNEAFNENGSLKENLWLKNIGEGYIEKCYTYAAEADPAAILFYNDFDLESKPQKLDAVLKFFSHLKTKGVKIDGIGMQMHINIIAPYLSDISMATMKIEDQGFLVHYSEFDISLVETGKLWMLSRHLLIQQGQRMKGIITGYRKLNIGNRFGITMWGLCDDDSWLLEKNGRDLPLLFNASYKVKPAYCGFLEALAE